MFIRILELATIIAVTASVLRTLYFVREARRDAREAAERALGHGTAEAIEVALLLHMMPRKVRRHLERRRDELRAEEVLRREKV